MPDTDSSDDDPSIDSDSDIYGAVDTTESGVVIDEAASPVELPTIHDDKLSRPDQDITDVDQFDTDEWMVGQANNGNFQIWVPAGEAEVTVDDRLELSNPERTVRVGHGLREPWVDEVYMVPHTTVRDRISRFDVHDSTEYPHVRIPEQGADPLTSGLSSIPDRRPYQDIDMLGGWLHGTDPDSGSAWEIFVPAEDATVTIEDRLFVVEWDENAILRRNSGGFNITGRQDGLRCRQLFAVNEERVPLEPEGNIRETDAVQRYETDVDIIGNSN